MQKYVRTDVHVKDPMIDIIFKEAEDLGMIDSNGNVDYPALVKAMLEEPDPLELPESVLEEQRNWAKDNAPM